jgi:lipopolysaccharide export system protein LptA
VVDSPSGQAIGDTGIYEVAQQVLHLTGNVVLTKDANVMRGSALEVSMATGIAHLTAEPQTTPAGQTPGRVQGLFVPQQQAGAATAANPPKP